MSPEISEKSFEEAIEYRTTTTANTSRQLLEATLH